jgi:hypothetical protein
MHIISAPHDPSIALACPVEEPCPVDVQWHLPEVEWHEATLTLAEANSLLDVPITSWQIDANYDGGSFAPTWSSGRSRRRRSDGIVRLQRVARIRVPRHDGPCLIAVRLEDASGDQSVTVLSRNRR